MLYLQLICSDLREEREGGWEKLDWEVDEQVEEELGRFLLSLVHGEDGLVQGEDGPGDVVVVVDVVSTSNDLIRDSVNSHFTRSF